ncbi:MAG: hypothetical protein P1U77_10455 [Rubripirellula sp.]|nr:hypothetical protein [Rubripirellula sp.]
MELFRNAVEIVGLVIDGAGVVVIVVGMLIAAFRFMFDRQQ